MNKCIRNKVIYYIICFMSIIILTFTPDLSESQSQNACVNSIDLINLDPIQFDSISPCDKIGALYIFGIAGTESPQLNSVVTTGVDFDFAVYNAYRLVLFAKNFPESSPYSNDEISTMLVAANTIILMGGYNQNFDVDNNLRYLMYYLYYLNNYHQMVPSVRAEYAGMTALSSEMVAEYLLKNDRIDLSHVVLDCFVEFDLPMFGIDTILDSNNYKSCALRMG